MVRQISYCVNFPVITPNVKLAGTRDILINYERCPISSGSFEISSTRAVGTGITLFSSALETARVILPSPIQDTLTTVFHDCNAEW